MDGVPAGVVLEAGGGVTTNLKVGVEAGVVVAGATLLGSGLAVD